MKTLINEVKGSDTKELLKRVEKLTGSEQEACLQVLRDRNIDVTDIDAIILTSTVRLDIERKARRSRLTENLQKPEISVKYIKGKGDKETLMKPLFVENSKTSTKEEVKKPGKKEEVKPSKEEVKFPKGFAKGTEVTFIGSTRSDEPGAQITGTIKKISVNKKNIQFFTIESGGKKYYRRPSRVTKK